MIGIIVIGLILYTNGIWAYISVTINSSARSELEWTYRAFYWPLIVTKHLIINLYRVLVNDWKFNDK